MKQKIILSFVAALLCGAAFCYAGPASGKAAPSVRETVVPVFNRAPLEQNDFAELPLGSIKPQGWLLEQLQRMRDGMAGHLDELYPQVVGDNNAWLGGEGDTWERGPYWIDGLLPLAYILGDEPLIAKSMKWTEAMLTSAQENGYFGNRISRPYIEGLQRGMAEDWWPKMVAVKILRQYYQATGDPRALDVLKGYFRYQLEHLDATPLGHWSFWGEWRAGDNMDVVYWLYNITGEAFLLDLAAKIHSQAVPMTQMMTSGEIFRRQGSAHTVNLAQGFKEPVIWWQQSHDEADRKAPEQAMDVIRTTIGLPTGLWAGDEMIHFGDPARGSEFCTAVEMMYSLEQMLKADGNLRWADHLERVAFNALPTQATDTYDARQYYQQTNQIACTYQRRNFITEHDGTDVVFSLLGGYPCCTCNMHQGWPKFVQNLWYATRDGGLAALVYSPCSVEARVGDGTLVAVNEDTVYPFDGRLGFKLDFPELKGRRKAKHVSEFPLYLRIPQWCTEPILEVNGEMVPVVTGERLVCIRRQWRSGDVVSLELPMKVGLSRWWDDAVAVERGPLVYALKMNERWERKSFPENKRGQFGPYYYEVTSDSAWNLALPWWVTQKPEEAFEVEQKAFEGYPWNVDAAPVTLKVQMVTVPYWKEYGGSVGPLNYTTQTAGDFGEAVPVELVPYGCTTLRIAEFPVR